MKAQSSEVKQPETEPAREPTPEYVTLARIQTTHGRQGEVAADLLTDFPERFEPGLEVLVGTGERQRRLRIEDAWLHRGKHPERLILKFQSVDSLTDAEALCDSTIQLPLAERHALPQGRLYVSDLIGCAVIERGSVLGKVEAWDETGGVPLLRVGGHGADGLADAQANAQDDALLIPYTPEICYAVDIANKEIHVRLPEGLQKLNAISRARKTGRRKKGGA